jgi:hypothetical protein
MKINLTDFETDFTLPTKLLILHIKIPGADGTAVAVFVDEDGVVIVEALGDNLWIRASAACPYISSILICDYVFQL